MCDYKYGSFYGSVDEIVVVMDGDSATVTLVDHKTIKTFIPPPILAVPHFNGVPRLSGDIDCEPWKLN